MQPFPAKFADTLERLQAAGSACRETVSSITITRVDADSVKELSSFAAGQGWSFRVEDASEDVVDDPMSLDNSVGPYKVVIGKAPLDDHLYFITSGGFEDWLKDPTNDRRIHLAGLTVPFETLSFCAITWHGAGELLPYAEINARPFVREVGDARLVPSDLRPWIATDVSKLPWTDKFFRIWAGLAVPPLLYSLANEVKSDGSLSFNGPTASKFDRPNSVIERISSEDFKALQELVRWVYMSSAEAETRQGLVANEIGRSNCGSSDPAVIIAVAFRQALEGARIAHQLGVKKLSADTLKALSDLRKAIADEASKLSDSTRQLVSATTGALFIGLGAALTRMSVKDAPTLTPALVIVAIVLTIYMITIIYSGWQFLVIQQQLRAGWRDRLYRFLPEHEYRLMVVDPANRAEKVFKTTAYGCGLASVLLVVGMLVVAFPASWEWASGRIDKLWSYIMMAVC